MNPDLPSDGGLRSIAHRMERTSRPISADEVRAPHAPLRFRRTGRRVSIAVAIAAVVTMAVSASVVVLTRDGQSTIRAADDGIDLAPGECTALPAGPLSARSGHTAVWTGDEMIVWGGNDGRTAVDDGAAYNPRTGSWHRIPNAPIAGRFDHVAVWTGDEMLIWGGNDHQRSFTDGAAYNPTSNTWRRIADAPLHGSILPTTVWTGSELIVTDGMAGFRGDRQRHPKAYAYNVAADRWQTLAPPPVDSASMLRSGVWTGRLAVFTVDHLRRLSQAGAEGLSVVAYDPRSHRWATATGLAIEPVTDGSSSSLPDGKLMWDGSRVLLTTGPEFPNYSIDPRTLDAQPIARPGDGLVPELQTWTGNQALYWSSGLTIAYAPSDDAWTHLASHAIPATFIQGEAGAWTGRTFLVWGGFVNAGDGQIRQLAGGVAYRPSTAIADSVGCPLRQEQARLISTSPAQSTRPATVPQSWHSVANDMEKVELDVPSSWHRLATVPKRSPPELLVVGNAPRPRRTFLGACPARRWSNSSMSIAISEYVGSGPFRDGRGVPVDGPMPDRSADLASSPTRQFACPSTSRDRNAAPVASILTWDFRDHGRLLNATVLLAPDATEADRNLAFDVLNTLRVDPLDLSFPLSSNDEAEIRNAFEGWLDAQPHDSVASFVEGYPRIADAIRDARPITPDGTWTASGRVDQLNGLAPNSAQVFYSIVAADGSVLAQREGRAVKTNGIWKVSRDTACALVALGGSTACSPP